MASSHGSCQLCATVDDILAWKNPITTGCILATTNVVFFLFAVLGYSIVSITCNISIFFLVLGLVSSLVLKSNTEAQRVEVISKSQVEDNLLLIYDFVNDTAGNLRQIVMWHDMTTSLKALVGLVIFAWVASWFSVASLVFLGVWGVFTHVYVLEAYRSYLEPLVRPHISRASEAILLAYNQIPRMGDAKKIE